LTYGNKVLYNRCRRNIKEKYTLFKSTFAKYLAVFVIIILLSFVILSSIITTTIRSYVTETKEDQLIRTCAAISGPMLNIWNTEDIKAYVVSGVAASSVRSMINIDDEVKIMIADAEGNILLTSVETVEIKGQREPLTVKDGELGTLSFENFKAKKDKSGNQYFMYNGPMSSIGNGKYKICATEIAKDGVLRGYAVALISTLKDDAMVSAAKKTIFNSSLWVMLASVVAVYLTTEKITTPLKNMTKATKSFAKGDFSTRVAVSGNDEIAELGSAFNNMAESLDNFEKMRNSFLANVSHDLRTPMTTIAGFIDGITSGAIPPEKHEYYLGIISSEVHRLSRLVSELLDVSRLESGERKFNFVNFDLAEMARIILISFEKKIEDKRLDVQFESDEDSMTVFADKDAIHQVVYNLIHNAIKFAREEGKLSVSVTRYNKKIRFSVYDEGTGIDKNEINLIFDRFYKADKSRGLDKSGVGLGLYISKTIIEAHNESIHAESKDENSAEFWFTLKEGSHTSKDVLK